MLKLRRLCCTSRGIEIPLCENVVDYLQENAITKQPAVLVISSSPFLKNIAQIASHSFLAESALFHQFLFFLPYLSLHALKPITEYVCRIACRPHVAIQEGFRAYNVAFGVFVMSHGGQEGMCG